MELIISPHMLRGTEKLLERMKELEVGTDMMTSAKVLGQIEEKVRVFNHEVKNLLEVIWNDEEGGV